MCPSRASQVDLAKLFNTVAKTMVENQETLNSADEYNHNHGDNMVKNFQVITKAVRAKKGSTPSEQLAYASQVLSQRSQSGSAQLYSQGLAQAADRFQGRPAITQDDAMMLVQSLMGGQAGAPQGQAGGGDLLGGLLGAFMGGGTAEAQPAQAAAGASGPSGIDLNTLLTAGMAFFQARQQGAAPMQALVQAVMAGSQMQNSPHQSQSGQLVAQTLINSLGSMLAK